MQRNVSLVGARFLRGNVLDCRVSLEDGKRVLQPAFGNQKIDVAEGSELRPVVVLRYVRPLQYRHRNFGLVHAVEDSVEMPAHHPLSARHREEVKQSETVQIRIVGTGKKAGQSVVIGEPDLRSTQPSRC